MNTTTIASRNLAFIGTTLALFAVASLGVGAFAAHAAITSQLDLGSTGADVTQLQNYLSANPNLYASALVTGYFGPLTQGGVQKFQIQQGIVSSGSPSTTGFGRVGPTTMAALNVFIGGGDNSVTWDTVPVLSTPNVSQTSTTATINWTTNEPTVGQVYWSIAPIQSDEATGPRQQPYVSGALAVDAGGLQTSHTVTISNLQPNTPYNFLVRSVDSVGNMSMELPSAFRTTP